MRKGYHHTEEAKRKMREIALRDGRKPPVFRGHTVKTRMKMSMLIKNEDNPNWRGGISTYERKLYLNGRRRAIKNGAKGSHTQGEWELLKRQYGFACPACRRSEPEVKLTEDHIIPLSRGGSDYIENIQPLCRSCNSAKHTKVTKY